MDYNNDLDEALFKESRVYAYHPWIVAGGWGVVAVCCIILSFI